MSVPAQRPVTASPSPCWDWRRVLLAMAPGLVVMLADTETGSVIAAAQGGAAWGYRLLPLDPAAVPDAGPGGAGGGLYDKITDIASAFTQGLGETVGHLVFGLGLAAGSLIAALLLPVVLGGLYLLGHTEVAPPYGLRRRESVVVGAVFLLTSGGALYAGVAGCLG